jgi:RNA polymerase sigma factor (sigma-70 family)
LSYTYSTRKTLLQRARDQHDEVSWNELVLIYRKYVYAVIKSLKISDDDAEDVLQQVFLKLWKRLPEIDIEGVVRFRSLLSQITKHCTIDFIRKRSTAAEKLKEAARSDALDYLSAVELPEIDRVIEEKWEVFLTNLALDNVESQFTGQAVQAFRMSLAGTDAKVIAEELGIEVNSVYRLRGRVKTHLVREIKHLREELE